MTADRVSDLPTTTVVIACHELANLPGILAAIESVHAQTRKASGCVVAVDHNPALAAALGDVDGVQVVENTSVHRGASATRNAGAAAARTDVVAFLDDDEVAAPDWLEQLLPPLAEVSVVGVGGRYVPLWTSARPVWFPDELAWVVGAHHSGQPTVQSTVRNVWSGNMAVKADLFDKIEGFRLGFGKAGGVSRPEDTDLCIRLAKVVEGGRWVYVPTAAIEHTVPGDRATFGFYVRRCYAEGRGKIELRDVIGDADVLDTERDYLRRTIPLGFLRHLRHAARAAIGGDGRTALAALSRAGAICVGIGAAAVGGAVSTIALRRGRG